ncbi:MAG: adenosylcobinamide-GDP ribazoletransferase [Erysipelotrichales bacterium]
MVKQLLNNFFFTLSTFSKIPTPYIEYNKANTKYTFLCLPLVGVVLGLIYYGSYLALDYFIDESMVIAIILIIVNIEVTGGIHLDGLLDSLDAFKSYRDYDDKKRIIKDSRIGAFALIHYSAILLIYFVAYYYMAELGLGMLLLVTPILSRSFVLLLICNNKREKNDMLDDLVSDEIVKKHVIIVFSFVAIATVISYFFWNIDSFGVLMLGTMGYLMYFNKMYKRHFKEMNGDLCGYCITSIEYIAPIILVIYTIVLPYI